MGARALVGTSKMYCLCMTESGDEIYIKVSAKSEADASEKVHQAYKTVEYVIEVLTPLQMEQVRRKKRTSRSLMHSSSVI